MSKSYDNYIGITDPPSEIYGRTMSIPDDLIVRYFEFATDVDSTVLKDVQTKLSDGKTNPRDLKRQLAREIVSLYHSDELALEAEGEFDRIFIESDVPDKMEEWSTGAAEVTILSIMCDSGLVPSKREARRLIGQGAVTVDGEKVSDITENINVSSPVVLKVGKRRFLRVSA
jgi:tyrosyl-tRNA synthetase